MALYLYRLGQAAFRHRRLALGLWVLILIGASVGRSNAAGAQLHELLHPRHRGTAGHRHAPGTLPGGERHGRLGAGRLRCARGRLAHRPRERGQGERRARGAGCASQCRGGERPVQDRRRQPRRASGAGSGRLHHSRHRDERCRPRRIAGSGRRRPGVGDHRRGRRAGAPAHPGARRIRGDRHRDRGGRAAHHVRILRRRRPAPADCAVRHRHRRRADHGSQRIRVAERHDVDPGGHDRSGRLHRLRAVHPVAVPLGARR